MRNSIDKHRIKSKGDREALLEKLLDFRKNKNTYGIGMDIDEQLRILQQVPSLGGGEECITLIRNLAIVKATARIDCEPYPYEEEDPGDKYITEVPGLMIQTSDVFGSVYSLTPPISGNGKENHERLERIVDDMKASLRFLNIDEIKYNSLFQERVIVWQKEKQNDSEAALDQERYEWVVRTGSSKIGMPLTEADRECLKSKMKEHCVNPEYMDAAIQNKDIRYLNLGSVNELIFSYQVENRLIAPVKRTPVADCIFFGTHTDHHTVKWNGKEWEGFDFDENQEIDVYR
ncbi:MAG: hypothetical protein KKE20_07220, partial [Nanoarchaeota archaeon]|nr:hypothetical protein [Nanoarchaeota archaeon]